MKKAFECHLALGLVILFLTSIGLPQNVFASDIDSKAAAETAIVTEKPDITYGPYDNVVTDEKHTYEPFDENEVKKSKDIKGLNYTKDRVLVKMEQASSILGIFKAKAPSLKNSSVTKLELIDEGKKDSGDAKIESTENDNGEQWYTASLKEGSDVPKIIVKIIR